MAQNVPVLIGQTEALCELDPPPAIFAAGRAIMQAMAQGLDVPVIGGIRDIATTVENLVAQPVNRQIVSSEFASGGLTDTAACEIDGQGPGGNYEAFSRTTLSAADAARDAARHAFAMERLAYRDALTGLWNRRAYDDRYAAVSEADGPSATVLIVDPGGFKTSMTCTTTGRVMPRSSAWPARCSAVVRVGDFLARYGGDEFAISSPVPAFQRL